jgi:hypothetical protein
MLQPFNDLLCLADISPALLTIQPHCLDLATREREFPHF